MNITSLLEKEIATVISAQATIDKFCKDICRRTKKNVWNKHADATHIRDGHKYRLFYVQTRLDISTSDITSEMRKVDVTLYMETLEKLPKAKRIKLEEAKEMIEEKDATWYRDNYNIPIIIELCYHIEIQKALTGEFNLTT